VLVSLYPSTSKWEFQKDILSVSLSRGSFMQVIFKLYLRWCFSMSLRSKYHYFIWFYIQLFYLLLI